MWPNGEVTQGDLPKDIYKMREEFQHYALMMFCNGFYNIKHDTGFHLRENMARTKVLHFCLLFFEWCSIFSHNSHILCTHSPDLDYSDNEGFEDAKPPAKGKSFLAGLGGNTPGELAKNDDQNPKWYPIMLVWLQVTYWESKMRHNG
jgi:hypothetical protein